MKPYTASEILESLSGYCDASENGGYGTLSTQIVREFIEDLRTVICDCALATRPAVQQEGMVLVPVEPTREMKEAGRFWVKKGFDWEAAVYRAMVRAAPPAAACAKDDK